jgi:hypothetical protein
MLVRRWFMSVRPGAVDDRDRHPADRARAWRGSAGDTRSARRGTARAAHVRHPVRADGALGADVVAGPGSLWLHVVNADGGWLEVARAENKLIFDTGCCTRSGCGRSRGQQASRWPRDRGSLTTDESAPAASSNVMNEGINMGQIFVHVNVSLDGYIERANHDIEWQFVDAAFEESPRHICRSGAFSRPRMSGDPAAVGQPGTCRGGFAGGGRARQGRAREQG